MTQLSDTAITNFLGTFIFKNAWNETTREYRQLIVPTPNLPTPIVSTSAMVLGRAISLPDANTKFMVYTIPRKAFKGLRVIEIGDWIRSDRLNKHYNLLIDFVSLDGIIIPKRNVFIRSVPGTELLLFVVTRAAFAQLLGQSYDTRKVVVRVTTESDKIKDIYWRSHSFKEGGVDESPTGMLEGAKLVLFNGHAVYTDNIPPFAADTRIDILHDGNFLGDFSIPMEQLKTFTSSLDGKLKYIIPIPKQINIDKVITYDTCDMFYVDSEGKGILLLDSQYKKSQITHSCFSLEVQRLTEYMDVNRLTGGSIRVIVRNFAKNNLLDMDKNYTKFLYTLDDATILSFLSGENPHNFGFWHAATLEASGYTKGLIDADDIISDTDAASYIDTLGYYNTAALISERQGSMLVDDLFHYSFIIRKPIIFSGKPVTVFVYLNGKKLNPTEYTIITSELRILVTLISKPTLGAEISYEIFSALKRSVDRIVVTPINCTYALPVGKVELYEQVLVPSTRLIDDTFSSDGYKQVTLGSAGNVIGDTFVFNTNSYGKVFLIVHQVGSEYSSYNIDSTIGSYELVTRSLKTTLTNNLAERTFKIGVHNSIGSTTGMIIEPKDLNGTSAQPVWRLFNNPPLDQETHMWRTQLVNNRAEFTYTLATIYNNRYFMTAVKLTRSLTRDVSEAPSHIDLYIDDVLVETFVDFEWSNDTVTRMLSSPIRVGSTIRAVFSHKDGYLSMNGFEPIFTEPDFSVTLPAIGSTEYLVYLNGRELIRGMDFDVINVNSGNGAVVDYRLVLHNCAYLNTKNNQLEIMACYEPVLDRVSTFKESLRIFSGSPLVSFHSNISSVIADGYHNTKAISASYGNLDINQEVRLGAPVALRTIVPSGAAEYIDKHHPTARAEADAITTALLNYFSDEVTRPAMVVIPYTHRLVSIYIASILRDILSGKLVVQNFEHDAAFYNQFLAYEHLKKYDVFFRPGAVVDMNYVDLQAAFIEAVTKYVHVYDIIRRLKLTITDKVQGRPSHEPIPS